MPAEESKEATGVGGETKEGGEGGEVTDLPVGPTPEELAQQKADEELRSRIDGVLEAFTNDEAGVKTIDYAEVGHAVRGCGCFVPEIVLVDSILPACTEPEYADLKVVRPELLANLVFKMIRERTWEADTEGELLGVFRWLDRHTHNGDELGYIEADRMEAYMTKQGFAPLRTEEQAAFASYANDETGRRMYYHDYIGTLLPFLDDEDYLTRSKPLTTPEGGF